MAFRPVKRPAEKHFQRVAFTATLRREIREVVDFSVWVEVVEEAINVSVNGVSGESGILTIPLATCWLCGIA